MNFATAPGPTEPQFAGEPLPDVRLASAAYWLTLFAAMAPIISTAVMNILLGAAVAVTLLVYRRLEMPRGLLLPLILFFGGTLAAVLASPDPAAGLPQIKKFYIYLALPLTFTVFRRHGRLERLVAGWAVLAAASALWSFGQFLMKREEATALGQNFYLHYVGRRATGFMSHWMTFAGEQMIVVLVMTAVLLFAGTHRHRRFLLLAAGLIGLSLAISFVRAAWLGAGIGLIYLLATWRPKSLLLLPIVGVLGWLVAPGSIQQRVLSIYKPHGTTDSNQHREITRAMGIEMIRTSPWVGIGPEMIKRDYEKYVPSDVPRPLPTGYYLHLHNLYLQYAAERGVPTLIFLLWFIAAVFLQMWRAAKRLNPSYWLTRSFVSASVAVVLAILAEGLFEVNLGDSEVLMMFLTTLGCAYALTERSMCDV